jgi:hypothetical protein
LVSRINPHVPKVVWHVVCDTLMLLYMLGPEHDLGERVEQLLYLRYDGPDAFPQGYEEADGEEYASTAAAIGQQPLCHSTV